MLRIAFIFFVLLTSVALCDEPDKELHEKCLYPTIMITSSDQKSIGTGVIVKCVKKDEEYENYAFTCSHVLVPVAEIFIISLNSKNSPVIVKPIEDKYEMFVRIGVYENWSTLVGYKEHPCEVIVNNQEKDIALIKFRTTTKSFVADVEKDHKVYIGNQVCRVGCGMNEPFRLDFGQITSLKDSIGNAVKGTYRVNIPTIMGDSGGPVFNENKLFGLVQSIRSIQSSSVLIPVSHMVYVVPIKNFYDSEKIVENLKD